MRAMSRCGHPCLARWLGAKYESLVLLPVLALSSPGPAPVTYRGHDVPRTAELGELGRGRGGSGKMKEHRGGV